MSRRVLGTVNWQPDIHDRQTRISRTPEVVTRCSDVCSCTTRGTHSNWDNHGQPALSAYGADLAAEIFTGSTLWLDTGQNGATASHPTPFCLQRSFGFFGFL